VRLYIGNSKVFLDPGPYTYTIKYRTQNQLGFFADHDELYFNVTGNGWSFPINFASATIQLPPGVKRQDVELTAFTGISGSTWRNYTAELKGSDDQLSAYFETTYPLSAEAGLTVAVSWPKGFIPEPTQIQKLWWLMQANLVQTMGPILLLATMAYCLLNWLKYGRDPKGLGTLVTRFDIQKDISPAGARFINEMESDKKAVTASLVNLALKGLIKIREKKVFSDKEFVLERTEKESGRLFEEEKVLLDSFFSGKRKKLTLETAESDTVNEAIMDFDASLEKQYVPKYVKNNYQLLTRPGIAGFLYFLLVLITSSWGFASIASMLGIIVVLIISAIAFKVRTKLGREIQDQILGLKSYLTAVETPRYKSTINYEVPDNLRVYEKYLPYAIALDVEPIWTSRFKEQIARAQIDQTAEGGIYPLSSFYTGTALAGSLGDSLTNAISSSANPPGSSSGFSGGGSSGGGGGGGGGGGW
ncbi:MAG: DUF2207 domain-containing protein, partial [bacterium]